MTAPDTPRTDAQLIFDVRNQDERYALVPADFARQLKRENAALVAALEGVVRVADRKTDEFDAARAALALAKGAAK